MWSIDRQHTDAIRNVDRGTGAGAIFVRVADTVAADIRHGVLRAGDRLPSTRDLAEQLGVNRNTIVAAYDELVAQGWATSRGPAGTFVAADLPQRPLRGPGPARARRVNGPARGPSRSTLQCDQRLRH